METEKQKKKLAKHLICRTSNIPALPLFKRCYHADSRLSNYYWDDCRNASLLRFRNCGVVTRFFSIDMRHRIASVLFFGSPVLLVNFR